MPVEDSTVDPSTGRAVGASVAGVVGDGQAGQGSVGDFLERLAARSPTPAGGSVAALCAAQASALVVMVARYCEQEPLVEQAERLVTQAQRLADDDEQAFGAVAAAWALPRATPSEEQVRRTAIDEALVAAALPQALVVEIAIEVLVLIDQLRPSARPGLAADLVAAGEVARAACAIARGNVESNLRTVPGSEARSGLLRRIGVVEKRN